MKRLICLVLALFVVLFCFAGCSKDAASTSPAPSAAPKTAAPSASASAPSAAATEAPAYFPLKDTAEIDWWCPWTFQESAQVFTTYADSICYQIEKTIKDLGDKLSEADKKTMTDGVSSLRAKLAGSDIEAIKSETETLRDKSFEIFGKIYQQDPNAAAGGATAEDAYQRPNDDQSYTGGGQTTSGGDNVVDADYEVVDDDKK
jgi:hypothetical protein